MSSSAMPPFKCNPNKKHRNDSRLASITNLNKCSAVAIAYAGAFFSLFLTWTFFRVSFKFSVSFDCQVFYLHFCLLINIATTRQTLIMNNKPVTTVKID